MTYRVPLIILHPKYRASNSFPLVMLNFTKIYLLEFTLGCALAGEIALPRYSLPSYFDRDWLDPHTGEGHNRVAHGLTCGAPRRQPSQMLD